MRRFKSTVFFMVLARWECDGVVQKWGVIKDRTTEFPLQRKRFPKVGAGRPAKEEIEKKIEKVMSRLPAEIRFAHKPYARL